MTAGISFNKFSLRYSSTEGWALSGLTFSIPTGACCAVLGAVSSGKSTLLLTISGLLGKHHRMAEARGTVSIQGHEEKTIPHDLLFPAVGLVMQDPYVMISGLHETVEEEIAFTVQNLGIPEVEIQGRVQETLALLNLERFAKRHPLQLSGGEVQRVALASMLVAKPGILLLDEPRNSLDSSGQHMLARLLQSLRGTTTILFTDYDLDLALAAANYVVVLDNGACVYHGDKQGFLERSDTFTTTLIAASWKQTLPALANIQDEKPATGRIRKVFGLSNVKV